MAAPDPHRPDLEIPPDLAIPGEPLPVSVLTGFLGSGKTTLLRHLLAAPGMAETAVIVNEFGEIGLDHLLMEKIDENTVLLNSGCLCCSIRGDLIDSLRRLYKQRVKRQVPAFERLVIETTGLADPAPILQTLMTDPLLAERYRLDGVIATVDGLAGAASLARHQESVKQAAVADRLLLTKADLAEAVALDGLEAQLREINPAAPVYRTVLGAIDPARLFDAGLYDPKTKTLEVQRWLQAEAYGRAGNHHHHGDSDVNRHSATIRAFCLTYDRPLDWERFNAWIEMLIMIYGAGLLRIKGLLNVAGSEHPLVIHGVQHVFHPPAQLDAWPDGDRRSKIVFITHDLDEATFAQSLKAFNEDSSAPLP